MNKLSDRTPIGPWIRRFLLEHLVGERNLSRNTQASYRDTLKLLLPFLSSQTRTSIDRLAIEDLSAPNVRRFLDHIEAERHCCGTTRNQRLAGIHAMARFIGAHSPQHLAWCAELRSVPYKKTTQKIIDCLDKAEMDALLKSPDRQTEKGARDYALLLFLYNTGARAEEAAQVTVTDIAFGSTASVRVLGKGNKIRCCPLWARTLAVLKPLIAGLGPDDRVFRGRTDEPLTRFGIYNIVRGAAHRARTHAPSLQKKSVGPHTIRHTCGAHLLRAGVDINTIRAWLGHVSVDTTNIYAEVDLEMKAKALAQCEVAEEPPVKQWRRQPALMEFLASL
jgi:integrase/recombinase XerD